MDKLAKYGLASYNIRANPKYANIIEALDKYDARDDEAKQNESNNNDDEHTALNTMRHPAVPIEEKVIE